MATGWAKQLSSTLAGCQFLSSTPSPILFLLSSSTFPVTNAPTLFLFSTHQFVSLTTLSSRAVCAGLLGLCILSLIMLESHKHPLMKRLDVSLLCRCVLLCKDSNFNTKQIGLSNFKSDPNVLPMPIHLKKIYIQYIVIVCCVDASILFLTSPSLTLWLSAC